MTALRLLAAPGYAVVGLLTAVATVAVHTLWWGLPLATAALAAALSGTGRGWLTRLPLGLGFAAGVAAALVPPPEGGYLVATDAAGWLLLLLALAALGAAVVTLPRPRRLPGRGTESARRGDPPRMRA